MPTACAKTEAGSAIVPPGADVGSAIGFLRAPFSFEAMRGLFQRLDAFDAETVTATLQDLTSEARAIVATGAKDLPTTTMLTVFMRYSGQGWEIPVHSEATEFAAGDEAKLLSASEDAYRGLFGRTIEGLAVEITIWSLTVSTHAAKTDHLEVLPASSTASVIRKRSVFDAALRRDVAATEVRRRDMVGDAGADGPAVIIEDETSTIITDAYRAVMRYDGALLIERKEADGCPRPRSTVRSCGTG